MANLFETTGGFLTDLHKRFGDVTALAGAGFDVEPGRVVGFLGPNGAGKTTAMRCIFGLVEPDSGSVTWNGKPITHNERLQFGYMPEERGLYPKMRIGEQLTYFGRLSGLSRSEAAQEAATWLGQAIRSFVRSVADGNETVPTVRVGGVALVNPTAGQLLQAAAEHAPGALPEDYEPPALGPLARAVTRLLGD